MYQNDAKLVKDMAERFTATGIKPQIEAFDSNMISNANQLVKQVCRPREVRVVCRLLGG